MGESVQIMTDKELERAISSMFVDLVGLLRWHLGHADEIPSRVRGLTVKECLEMYGVLIWEADRRGLDVRVRVER